MVNPKSAMVMENAFHCPALLANHVCVTLIGLVSTVMNQEHAQMAKLVSRGPASMAENAKQQVMAMVLSAYAGMDFTESTAKMFTLVII